MTTADDFDDTWGRIAHSYHIITGPNLLRYGLDLVSYLNLDSTSRVLDIGCGTGDLTLRIANNVKSVLAIDKSPGMVALAREVSNSSNIEYQIMDASNLEIGNATRDVAISNFAMMLLGDRGQALREARRVIKRGGRLGLTTWVSEDRSPAMSAFLAGMRAVGLAPADKKPEVKPFNIPSDIQAELSDAGFRVTKMWEQAHPIVRDSPADLWNKAAAGSPFLANHRHSTASADWDLRCRTAIRAIRDFLGTEGPVELSAPSIMVIAEVV